MGFSPQLSPPSTPSTSISTRVHMISSHTCGPQPLYDLWVVPSESDIDQYGEHMPLIPKLFYQII